MLRPITSNQVLVPEAGGGAQSLHDLAGLFDSFGGNISHPDAKVAWVTQHCQVRLNSGQLE